MGCKMINRAHGYVQLSLAAADASLNSHQLASSSIPQLYIWLEVH